VWKANQQLKRLEDLQNNAFKEAVRANRNPIALLPFMLRHSTPVLKTQPSLATLAPHGVSSNFHQV
jgi:hypothetical protein